MDPRGGMPMGASVRGYDISQAMGSHRHIQFGSPTPLPLAKPSPENEPRASKRHMGAQPEHAETADGLSRLAHVQTVPGALLMQSHRLLEDDPVDMDHTDKRFKTIRKSFSPEEEKAYANLCEQFLRNEEKVITVNELTAHLDGKIPARFNESERKAFVKSTYYNLAVQFSRIHKLQLRLLLSDTDSQRWVEEQLTQYPEEIRRREQDRRITELARDLAARAMSSSSPFIRPSEQEVARAKQLIQKWLNPALRPILLTRHEQPKKRRRSGTDAKKDLEAELE